MGDHFRVATFIAFKQLHERKQKELLAFWRDDTEALDPLARAIGVQNQRGVDAFLADRPEFSGLIYWGHFVKVVSIFGRYGIVNPDGSRAVYGLCSHIRHSSAPNAAWFTIKVGYPKGRKVLHVIGIEGIELGEEITVSHVPENVLLMPKVQRRMKILRLTGIDATDANDARSEEDDENIRKALERLQKMLAVRPPTDVSTEEALGLIGKLDKLLPFSMQVKAKAKVLVAQAMNELTQRAAWQEENKNQAHIIMWTGLDAETQEDRLKATKTLYEDAAKDFEYLLGQDALEILDKLEVGYNPVVDQHKLFSRYVKEREREAEALAQQPVWGEGYPASAATNRTPPTTSTSMSWEELFRGRAAAR